MKRFREVLNGQKLPDLTEIEQTYRQTLWRKQTQFIVLFALGLVIIGLTAMMYLSISSRTAAAGRDIQKMELEIREMDQEIEDLQAKLARLESAGEMSKRAREMGFRPVSADRVVYLPVQGYIERQPVVLASYERHPLIGAAAIPPQYTESLFEWLARLIEARQSQTWVLPEFQLAQSLSGSLPETQVQP